MLALGPSPLRQAGDIGVSPSSLHSADGGVEFCPPFQRGREGHDRLMMPGVTLSIDPALHEMDVVLVVGKAIAGFVNKFKHVNVPKQSRSSDNLSTFMTARQWGCENFACNGKTNRFHVGMGFTPKPSQFAASSITQAANPAECPSSFPQNSAGTQYARRVA